jgi:alpha-beta hydrolase superfamily lysophospholipase
MLYQPAAPGDWGQMQATADIVTSTEELTTEDTCKLFLRSWKTDSSQVLLILHGLGGHSGWYIDMGNVLSSRGVSVYAMEHRGFGRSGGLPGHIDNYHTYVEDIRYVVAQIRERHPGAAVYMLGHSMGAIFATYFAAKYGSLLTGVLFLNPWIEDTSSISLPTTLGILLGGIFKSKRYWRLAGGTETMTTNPEAVLMLQADPFWRRSETASFLVQILLMRLGVLGKAKQVTIPALVKQAEADKAVVVAATRRFYETLASSDKTWKTYPNYAHDSEFEQDRSLLDTDLVTWISAHAPETREVSSH